MEMCVNACEKHTTNNENAAKMIKGWLISNGALSSVRSSTRFTKDYSPTWQFDFSNHFCARHDFVCFCGAKFKVGFYSIT